MKLLSAEDEVELSHTVCAIPRHRSSEMGPAYDGEKALRKVRAGSYGCVAMDVMMPQQDDISVVWTLHVEGDRTPVVILTAETQPEDKITGLDTGADDYLIKPLAIWKLLARTHSMTWRLRYQEKRIQAGNVTLDMGERKLKALSSTRIDSKETRLIELFMWNLNKLLGDKEFFRRVWGKSKESDDEQLSLYISYPRQKLGAIQADLLIGGERGGNFVLQQRDI